MGVVEDDRVLTVVELAKRWKVNRKTIYVEIHEGRLPVLRLGRVIRVALKTIEECETQGRVDLPPR
jgi:excisionase family DNA binding protein